MGRTVCGLDPNSTNFGTLPPCFVRDHNTKRLMRSVYPNYDACTPEYKQILRMTTASVLCHRQWLVNNLPADHPLFSTSLFRMFSRRSRLVLFTKHFNLFGSQFMIAILEATDNQVIELILPIPILNQVKTFCF